MPWSWGWRALLAESHVKVFFMDHASLARAVSGRGSRRTWPLVTTGRCFWRVRVPSLRALVKGPWNQSGESEDAAVLTMRPDGSYGGGRSRRFIVDLRKSSTAS